MVFLQLVFWLFVLIGLIIHVIHLFVSGLIDDYKREQEQEKRLYEECNGPQWEASLMMRMKSKDNPLSGLDWEFSGCAQEYHQRMPIDDEAEEFIRNWKPCENYVELYGEEQLKKELQVQAKYIAKYNKEQGL